ncbi:MAG: hypothetical protein ACFFG0_27020 [Candidatus Thorarchaeota archaeon]
MKNISQQIKRGFLLWSWIAILGGYITTSTIFLSNLTMSLSQGMKIMSYGIISIITQVTFLIAILMLFIAWISFYKYSLYLFRVVFDETMNFSTDKHFFEDEPDSEVREVVFKTYKLFKTSLLYLIMCWFMMLMASIIPYIASISNL